MLWRANLLGSSAKGNEYFLKHLLGTHSNVHGRAESPRTSRPSDVTWRDDIPEGKLDLLVSADFRMTSTTLLSDVVFPAATWYEKHDLSTTDMHPFIHAFTPAIDPPWEAKSDFDTFHAIARKLSDMARTHLGDPQGPGERADAARHPGGDRRSPEASSATGGAATSPAIPGQTMPILQIVERDYTAIADKLGARRAAGRQARLHRQERHVPSSRRRSSAWPR